MNRSDRRSIKRLPTTLTPWEVAFVDAPFTIEGVETVGLILVVEQGTGIARAAGPLLAGESVWSVLSMAFLEPPSPGVPARPRRLLCNDADLARRLAKELKGCGVSVEYAAHLPEAERALDELEGHVNAMTAPGITEDLEAWSVALENLTKAAPWRVLPDEVLFQVDDLPDGHTLEAEVLGLLGEQRGIAVYPTPEDRHVFRLAAEYEMMELLAEVEVLQLFLDLPEELHPTERDACEAAGLVTSSGLYPRLMVLAGGQPSPANELAQRMLLAVVQAITAATVDDPASLLEAPTARRVQTTLGRVLLRTAPPATAPARALLADAEYAVAIGRMWFEEVQGERLVLVVKMRKADARRLARRIGGVDGLLLEPTVRGVEVVALRGKERVGSLVRVSPMTSELGELSMGTELLLCVSAGGPKRLRIRGKDFVQSQLVRMREA